MPATNPLQTPLLDDVSGAAPCSQAFASQMTDTSRAFGAQTAAEVPIARLPKKRVLQAVIRVAVATFSFERRR